MIAHFPPSPSQVWPMPLSLHPRYPPFIILPVCPLQCTLVPPRASHFGQAHHQRIGLHPVYRPSWTHRPRPASVGDNLSESPFAAASRFAEAPSEHVRPAPSLSRTGMGKHRLCRRGVSSSSTSTLIYSGRACEASNTRAAAACGGGPAPQSFPRCSARMWVARRRLCGDYQHCICPSWPNGALGPI